MPRFRLVAVLAGGSSSEREISLVSGAAVAAALAEAGYDARLVRVDRDNRFDLPAGTEAVFPALHGAWGEDGGVQAELEALGLPYVGSRPEAARLSFDKILSRDAFARAGVPVPEGRVLPPGADPGPPPPLPVVAKPPRQGSSVGVSIVRRPEEWLPAVEEARRWDPEVLVETYVPGREWTVPVIGAGDAAEALPVIEIRPKEGWYDWRAKYEDDADTGYFFPADGANAAEAALCGRAREVALAAFRAVGARDVGRVDFRVAPDGGVFALELNAIPGFTSHSLLPKAAEKAGIAFSALCARLVEGAS